MSNSTRSHGWPGLNRRSNVFFFFHKNEVRVIVCDKTPIFFFQQQFTRTPVQSFILCLLGLKRFQEDIIFHYYNMKDYNCLPAITFPPPEALSPGMIGL